jgi:hypothetical protein
MVGVEEFAVAAKTNVAKVGVIFAGGVYADEVVYWKVVVACCWPKTKRVRVPVKVPAAEVVAGMEMGP